MTHQISDFFPCPVSLITSGAIQYGVPRRDFCKWLPLRLILNSNFFAHPKSINLMTPSGISIILALFISLGEINEIDHKINNYYYK